MIWQDSSLQQPLLKLDTPRPHHGEWGLPTVVSLPPQGLLSGRDGGERWVGEEGGLGQERAWGLGLGGRSGEEWGVTLLVTAGCRRALVRAPWAESVLENRPDMLVS